MDILELGFQKVPVTTQGGLHETTMDMVLTFTLDCQSSTGEYRLDCSCQRRYRACY
ncbi:hypothetical protein AT1219_10884 [Vibrio alginolyticus]